MVPAILPHGGRCAVQATIGHTNSPAITTTPHGTSSRLNLPQAVNSSSSTSPPALANVSNRRSRRAAQLDQLSEEGGWSSQVSVPPPPRRMASLSSPTGTTPTDPFLGTGWGVVVPADTQPVGAAAQLNKQATLPKKAKAATALQPEGGRRRVRKPSSPFVAMKSSTGVMGLSLLQRKLMVEGKLTNMDVEEVQDSMSTESEPRRPKVPSLVAAATAAAAAAAARSSARPKRETMDIDPEDYADDDDYEEVADLPEYELTLDDDQTEIIEYDRQGKVKSRLTAAAPPLPSSDAPKQLAGSAPNDAYSDDDDDELDFTGGVDGASGGWTQFVAAEAGAERAAGGASSSGGSSSSSAAAGRPAQDGGPTRRSQSAAEALEAALIAADSNRAAAVMQRAAHAAAIADDDDEQAEWGLDELPAPRGGAGATFSGRDSAGNVSTVTRRTKGGKGEPRTLMEQLGVRGVGAGASADNDAADMSVVWGGNAGSSAIDLDEQEELLNRLFKPHKVKKLMEAQREVLDASMEMKKKAGGRGHAEHKLHSRLRIIAGSAAGRVLLSSQGAQTRPMMDKVRQAIFSMIQSQSGSMGDLPGSARWLDLFAGTGSVGLEALSRGVRESHFIEMDPWVTKTVLGKNIAACGFARKATVHTTKAEDFLQRAIDLPRFAGGAFDFISVCPPYLLVSYPQLMDLLHRSPLIHEGTIVFVEYPKQLAHEVPNVMGPLIAVRDRKYGRTWVRVFAPPDAAADEDDQRYS